jgi:hypothetical protein
LFDSSLNLFFDWDTKLFFNFRTRKPEFNSKKHGHDDAGLARMEETRHWWQKELFWKENKHDNPGTEAEFTHLQAEGRSD